MAWLRGKEGKEQGGRCRGKSRGEEREEGGGDRGRGKIMRKGISNKTVEEKEDEG
jgi:hypothetical protein